MIGNVLRILVLVFLATTIDRAEAVQPFHAPAVPSGSVTVRLHATEGIASGTTTVVTFGVPFPRGSLTQAQLATLRVLRNDVEIPANVSELTPWRHRFDSTVDGASVRVARVQIQHTTSAVYPNSDSITVEWGGQPRLRDQPTAVNPRDYWHRVTSGTFITADGVHEPDVFAVLPADWLTRGALKSARSLPFEPGNPHSRDDPAVNDATATWPGFQEAERSFKNDFYTVIHQDDPRVVLDYRYKTQREPWLYDRAAAMFILYFRSGSFVALREAVRAAQFYADRVGTNGLFQLQGADAKYSYNESMAYSYWTVGDATLLPRIQSVVGAFTSPHRWTPSTGFWTERTTGFKLLANVVAYEVLGGVSRRDAVEDILIAFRAHQDGAGGAIPPNRIDGGLYHYGNQHDGDWAPASLGASPWMSVLLTDAVLRAYATGEDAASAHFIRRMGGFLRASIVVTQDNDYNSNVSLAMSRYAMLADGSDGNVAPSDVEHSLEVAAFLAWADYFGRLTQQPDDTLRTAALSLYRTYDLGVNYWIRPNNPVSGLPAYYIDHWRKWAWKHRTSDGIDFALSADEPAPGTLFIDGFE